MFGDHFYHHSFKKITTSFGTLFNNITIIHRDRYGNEVERIKVPVKYGPLDQMRQRVLKDPNLLRGYAAKLPRMSFEITTVAYDATRKINTIRVNKKAIENNQQTVLRQFNGVPYNITFQLNILSKSVDDANQIIEQIIPWFTPAYTITINSIPDMDLKDDLPFVLESMTLDDNYEDDWLKRRDVVWTLTFSAKAIIYGPIREKAIITSVLTDFYFPTGSLDDPQNLAQSPREERITTYVVPPHATFEDPFDYAERWDSFSDGKRYDPVTGVDLPVVLKIKPTGITSSERLNRPKFV